VRRWLPFVTALVVVTAAGAATVQGTKRPDLIQAAFKGKDVVRCGAGRDIVSADAGDRVAADCEVISRRVSVDPYTNGDSQHESAVEPDNFAYGGTVVAAFQVGRRQTGAASNIGAAVSRDGGRTWQRSFLPGLTRNQGGDEIAASDPAVAYDAVHGLWLVSSLTIHQGGSKIFVSRATDGLSWEPPVEAASGPVLDKEWIACDNGAASPHRGRCYLLYTDDQRNIVVSQSSDDGGATWSPQVKASTILVGALPVIQPDGDVVVVAGDYRGEEALQGDIVALRSTDGGATFQRAVVSSFRSADNDPMRAIALPSLDADSNGTLYAAWHDCRFRATCRSNDIVLSTSADGLAWTPPTRVTSNLPALITGLAADPAQPGHLAVVSGVFRSGVRLGMQLTQSRDGGRNWTAPQRLDAQAMPMGWLARAEGGQMVGDYFSVAYVGDRVVPVYALGTSPLASGRLRQGVFATSLKALR
jgi:hypothetical protein